MKKKCKNKKITLSWPGFEHRPRANFENINSILLFLIFCSQNIYFLNFSHLYIHIQNSESTFLINAKAQIANLVQFSIFASASLLPLRASSFMYFFVCTTLNNVFLCMPWTKKNIWYIDPFLLWKGIYCCLNYYIEMHYILSISNLLSNYRLICMRVTKISVGYLSHN